MGFAPVTLPKKNMLYSCFLKILTRGAEELHTKQFSVAHIQSWPWYFVTFWCFRKFSSHDKWNEMWLLVISMVDTVSSQFDKWLKI